MGNTMKTWFEASKKRVSVREYLGAIERPVFDELRGFASWLNNEQARLVLMARNDVLKETVFFRDGIIGTNCFAAVVTKKNTQYMGGYLGEAFVLECVSRGIGTCWQGIGYRKSIVNDLVNLQSDEKVVAIITIGEWNNRLNRRVRKKSIEALTAGMAKPMFEKLPNWMKSAAICAQSAPSARNAQPYEFEFEGNNFFLINTSRNFGFGEVDCGIAMLHIELGAAACGEYGDWEFVDGVPRFTAYNPFET